MPRKKSNRGEKEKKEKKLPLENAKVTANKKEIYWIVGVMAGMIILILAVSSIAHGSNSFTYQTLRFTKTNYGGFPVYLYNYNFEDPRTNPPKKYNFHFLLREDPRENNVPVNGDIELFSPGSTIYVGINETLSQCKNASMDLASLSSFLTINLFDTKSGLSDLSQAKQNNLSHISCEKYPDNVVIMLQQANETRIDKTNNCYTISIANCNTMDAIEKFEVQAIIDAKQKALAG